MNYKHIFCAIVSIIAAIGAINWGLMAIDPKYNVVSNITGKKKAVDKTIYSLIALCGLASLICTITWIAKPDFNM
jgi:uncharacterized membrane protein YuzA (DUF378 family)